MPGFYLITSAMALIGVLVVIRPLLRRNERGAKTAFTSTQSDIAVLRAQIKELDQQHQNAPETAQSTRIELARRLLAATSRAETAQELRPAPPRATAMMGGLAMIGVPVLALGLYLGLGQPGMPDHPMTMSPRDVAKAIPQTPAAPPPPSQAEAEARARADAPAAAAPPEDKEYVALIDQLEKVIAERPTDIKGLRLLAKGQVRLGRYGAAWHSYAALIAELEKKDPGSVPALLYAQQAEAMALAAGGYISPQADALIAQALTRDPDLDVARYYRGLSLMQKGDGEQAIAIWQRLREDTPADTPLHEQLTQMLAQAQRNAAPTDPSRMTPLQRQEMIEGMVARLETRLREQGGSAEEWVKLMNAYVQLERPDEAARVYAMGLDALTDDTGAGFLREQALLLGGESTVIMAVDACVYEDVAVLRDHAGALIGLDLGTRTIGLAVSDGLRIVASPIETLPRTKFRQDAARLGAFIADRSAVGIVIGLPRNMDGTEGPRAQSVRAYAGNLCQSLGLPVVLWDERLSTAAAERMLIAADTSRKRRAEVIDKLAATYILQGALDRLSGLGKETHG